MISLKTFNLTDIKYFLPLFSEILAISLNTEIPEFNFGIIYEAFCVVTKKKYCLQGIHFFKLKCGQEINFKTIYFCKRGRHDKVMNIFVIAYSCCLQSVSTGSYNSFDFQIVSLN